MVADYVAEQLGLQAAEFTGSGTTETRWDHHDQIRDGHGYPTCEFDQWCALARWMYQRAWIGSTRAPVTRKVPTAACTPVQPNRRDCPLPVPFNLDNTRRRPHSAGGP